jgi:hypothetical protein
MTGPVAQHRRLRGQPLPVRLGRTDTAERSASLTGASRFQTHAFDCLDPYPGYGPKREPLARTKARPFWQTLAFWTPIATALCWFAIVAAACIIAVTLAHSERWA